MSLAPGARFGPFEVVSRLGAGGMGEVWRHAHLHDWSPDGTRFVMVGSQPAGSSADLGVVLGWFEELKRLAPTGR